MMKLLKELLESGKKFEFQELLEQLTYVLRNNIQTSDSITVDLIDIDFLEEVRDFLSNNNVPLYFGKHLKNLQFILVDDDFSRKHEIILVHKGAKKLMVDSASFPHTLLQERCYSSLEDVVSACKQHVGDLAGYFQELESIDKYCTVMEPIKPSFKEDYRRIFLDDRTWLHIEVTPDGLGTNIHLIGQSELWQDKLQTGLLKWDHDLDIVSNLMSVFDLSEFPKPTQESSNVGVVLEDRPVEAQVCSICLCEELPGIPGVPLPLCQNPSCGIYFHRNCLFQWLVACAGGRPPAFGVATGSCPTCLQPVSCNEKDC